MKKYKITAYPPKFSEYITIEKNNRINFTHNTYYQGLNDIFYGWNDSLKERVINNFTTIINNNWCRYY